MAPAVMSPEATKAVGPAVGRDSAAADLITPVLTADGLMHLYWATGATRPAHSTRALSLAVLGNEVPFTRRDLIPVAAVLCGAPVVAARARLGRRHRRERLLQAGTVAVCRGPRAAGRGLSAMALAGPVWVTGVRIGPDAHPGDAFRRLDITVHTSVCAGLAVAAMSVLRRKDPTGA